MTVDKVRWDLSELFSSPEDPAIDHNLAEGLKFAQEFEQRYRGRVAELSAGELAEMFQELEQHSLKSSKPGIYANLLHSLNTGDHAAGKLVSKLRQAGAEQGRHMVFLGLELAALSDEQVEKLYKDSRVIPYRHTIEEERRYRPHQLSEVEERLLSEISPVKDAAWVRLFEEATAAIKVNLGEQTLPLDGALARLYDPDRSSRIAAARAVTVALKEDLRTRTYIFNVLLQSKQIKDRLRGYPSWISARNLSNEISDEAAQALIDAVVSRYDLVERYYNVKRRLLGLEQLQEWDRYAPLLDKDREVSWEEAEQIVLSSYSRFSPRAGEIIRHFFEEGWIDAPLQDGKRGGAFCSAATPEFHPYVLLNFTGRQRDVLTLAHELGHGLHDVLSAQRNHVFDYHPPLTLAETASIFGEALTFDSLLAEEKDPQIRLSLLCKQLDDCCATIFRQIALNRFEDAVHNVRRAEGELSLEQVGELWQQHNQKMFGASLTFSEEYRVWWSYIGHFIHTPGYVYAYAFGNLLAYALYGAYRASPSQEFADSYLNALSLGGSQAPEVVARSMGLEIGDPAFWNSGLEVVEKMVAEVERLAGELQGH